MVKVLIVDDSHIAREMIATILVTDPDVQVIGKVSNGREAINFMNNQAIKPDIITTDINMPVMNGFELIEHVMAYYPVPILIVTILNKEANFMRALNLGALDIIEKPPPSGWDQLPKVGIEIIEKVKLLSKVKVITHLRGKKSDSKPAVSGEVVIPKNSRRIVCIASSTGGPNTLLRFLKMFPRDFPVPFFIIQHMSEGFFITGLVEWFRSSLALMVEEASHHRLIQPGTVYISPIAKHLIVLPERMMLDDRPAVKNQKPSADVLFESAARHFGANVIAIVLTGMGDDGADGVKIVSRYGGTVFAQTKESCVVSGMPESAINTGCVNKILEVEDMPKEIIKLL